MEHLIKRYEKYTREDIYYIFSKSEKPYAEKGAWGIKGIIGIPGSKSSYIFIVTLNKKKGVYSFDEGISKNGILTWQSQHAQKLNNKRIKHFINHDPLTDDILLFIRPDEQTQKYVYMGTLSYITHDYTRECPVHFKWKINDWNLDEAFNALHIKETDVLKQKEEPLLQKNNLVLVSSPTNNLLNGKGVDTETFHSTDINFEEENERNSALGQSGEEAVIKYEKEQLIKAGRNDLAEKVELTRITKSNIYPYDILSYDPVTGDEKYIEVKTTRGNIYSPFYISAREMKFSYDFHNKYFLYRVFDYNTDYNSGKLFIKQGYIKEFCTNKPVSYKCKII